MNTIYALDGTLFGLIIQFIILTLAVWIGSHVMASAYIFTWLRDWAQKQHKYIAELCCCQLCLAFWHAAFWQAVFGLNLLTAHPVAGVIVTGFAIWSASALIARVLTFMKDMVTRRNEATEANNILAFRPRQEYRSVRSKE